jgi:hypothetical protein
MNRKKYNNLKEYERICLFYRTSCKKSGYPIEYQFIEQHFETNTLPFLLIASRILPKDVTDFIINMLIVLLYGQYLFEHFECLCINDKSNYQITRSPKKGVIFPMFQSEYELKLVFVPKCDACKFGKKCKFYQCGSHVLGSRFCRNHMLCSCGYNKRIQDCMVTHR